MPRVTQLVYADGHEDEPSWEKVQAGLLGLQDGESATVRADDNVSMIVLRIVGLGYLVTGCGEGDRDYYSLIDRTLGDDPVTAFDGGNTNEYPRFAFVSQTLLLKALETFYQTGRRDDRYEWVFDRDACYG